MGNFVIWHGSSSGRVYRYLDCSCDLGDYSVTATTRDIMTYFMFALSEVAYVSCH